MSIELSAKVREGRPLFVLMPLLVVHLTLMSIQIESPAGATPFKRLTLQAGGPILNASSTAVGEAVRLWRGYLWLHGARQENSRLTARLQELELRDAARAQAGAENIRLRRLLALKEILALETIGARIVGRGPAPDFLSSALVIDRGSEDGIQVNAAVLSSDGVLGRTVLVSPSNAQVQVITNNDAAVGALVERTRSQGVCNGAGDPLLRLSYVGNSEAIEVNDAVLTSGLDGIFPKGLPLGRVVFSQKGSSVFRIVRVQPAADVARAEEVLVVVNRVPEAVSGIQNSEVRK
ncbi:MAG: hypothetical protein DMG07_06150 [Acidobacteria bacterium]|nr:MAG: hypothetical protein DMG07_06150 [Acidobacteriota bacterium]